MAETTINTQEFDAAQQEKAAATDNQDTNGGDLILGKFKSQEDLEKAYTESQRKITELSSGNTKPDGDVEEETPNDSVESLELSKGDDESQEGDTENQPLINMDSALNEFTETGEFSEATVKTFEKVGIPKQNLDLYVAGIEALSKISKMEGVALVGGETEYINMAKWAQANVSEGELKAYDAAVSSTDKFTRDNAILAMQSKYVAANGSESNLIQGGKGLQNGIRPFSSEADKQAAMADPRYKTNQDGWRDEVQQRIMAFAQS